MRWISRLILSTCRDIDFSEPDRGPRGAAPEQQNWVLVGRTPSAVSPRQPFHRLYWLERPPTVHAPNGFPARSSSPGRDSPDNPGSPAIARSPPAVRLAWRSASPRQVAPARPVRVVEASPLFRLRISMPARRGGSCCGGCASGGWPPRSRVSLLRVSRRGKTGPGLGSGAAAASGAASGSSIACARRSPRNVVGRSGRRR